MPADLPQLRNEPEPPNEIERLTQAAREALTDSMVERLSTTGANVLEVLDRLNDEDTKDAVLSAIDQLAELNRMGAIGTLFDTLAVLHAARSAATDSMIERLFGFAENVLGMVDDAELVERLNDPDTRDAIVSAIDRVTALHRLGAMNTAFDTIGILHAARSATTDSIIERLFGFVERLLGAIDDEEIFDRLGNPVTRDAILTILDRMTELHRIGGLGTAFDTLSFIHAARSAATDGMVERAGRVGRAGLGHPRQRKSRDDGGQFGRGDGRGRRASGRPDLQRRVVLDARHAGETRDPTLASISDHHRPEAPGKERRRQTLGRASHTGLAAQSAAASPLPGLAIESARV